MVLDDQDVDPPRDRLARGWRVRVAQPLYRTTFPGNTRPLPWRGFSSPWCNC